MPSILLSITLTMLVSLSPLPALARDDTGLDRLVAERLSHMRDVAAWKWRNDAPVDDPAREQVVLEAAVVAGLQYGLTRAGTTAFFAAQIDAAKEIQQYWFERWSRGGAPTQAPDLALVTRPELLRLGDAIVAALGDPAMGRGVDIRVTGLSRATVRRLDTAARAITRYDNRLDQVRDSHVLRVGTTGDYAPFSHTIDGREFEGIDIDLANDLAASLGARPVFVRTTWPTLVGDLVAGRFDIAMSGVSRTLDRQQVGYQSRAYHTGGKTPLARCTDRDRFDSLAGIDRPGVRVIVNPGGTNQRFITDNVTQATVILFDDNRRIFDEIVAGRADVMITDAVEVALVTRRNAALCATMANRTLTFQEKGYLMPRDAPLKHYVDLWLDQRLGDGTVRAVFDRHLAR